MAESKIQSRGIILLKKTKKVQIGTTDTFVSFSFSVPSGYTIVSPVVYHSYGSEVQGGIENVSNSGINGYFKRPNGTTSISFQLNAIAIPNELLRSITVS